MNSTKRKIIPTKTNFFLFLWMMDDGKNTSFGFTVGVFFWGWTIEVIPGIVFDKIGLGIAVGLLLRIGSGFLFNGNKNEKKAP